MGVKLNRKKTEWKICPVCGGEYPALRAKICEDCKDKGHKQGYLVDEWIEKNVKIG